MNFPSQIFFNDIDHGYRAAILNSILKSILKFFVAASILDGCGYLFLLWKGAQNDVYCNCIKAPPKFRWGLGQRISLWWELRIHLQLMCGRGCCVYFYCIKRCMFWWTWSWICRLKICIGLVGRGLPLMVVCICVLVGV